MGRIEAHGRTLLAQAMRKLLRKNTVERIRVTDVCRRDAGVGRQTFYYHFRDKHDLMAWMFAQTMGSLDIISMAEVTAALERMKADYVFFARAYEDSSQVPFWQYMLEYYVERFADRARSCLGTDELSAETMFHIRFYSYGGFNVTREWLTGSDTSAAELVQRKYVSMPQYLREVYRLELDT